MGISYVIPIYNAELTIRRCLNSLIVANIGEIEIICVNDGSTDNSLDIIIEYSNKYDFIRYIDKKNEGPFIARKIGVNLATKEYIGFIDSDDWIEKELIFRVSIIIKKYDCDIILFQYINDYINMESTVSKIDLKSKLYKKKEFKKDIYPLLMYDGFLNGLCNKIYKRELFINSEDIDFKYSYGEDLVYQLDVFDKANSLFFIDDNLYHYTHERNDSLSNTKQDIDILLDMYKIRKEYQKKWQINEQILITSFLNLICMCFLTALKELNVKEIVKILKSKDIEKAVNKAFIIPSKSKKIVFLYKLFRLWFG